MNRRVVITGIGLVSSLGIGTKANWDALVAGTSGVHRITKFDASGFAAQIAGEVKGFDPLQFIDKKDVKKMDVFIQYAVAAAQFAMDDSKLEVTPQNADAIGVYIACSRAVRGRFHRSSSPLPLSILQPARYRFVSAPKDRIPRRAPPAPLRRTRLGTRSRSSGAATPTP